MAADASSADPLAPRVLAGLRACGSDRDYALIDFPNYRNPGDSAIWLGARAALAAVTGRPPAYSSTIDGFSAPECRRRIGDGAVFLLGGGSFGDLYPRHHAARLRVLAAVKDQPVVQLPVSCAWDAGAGDAAMVEATGRALAACRRLTLFARERKSQAELARLFSVEAELCPDLCHVLDFDPRPPTRDAVAILRRDRERAPGAADAAGAADWYDLPGLGLRNRLAKLVFAAAPRSRRLAVQDWCAGLRLRPALDLVAGARHVTSDRLHALLLAVKLGRRISLLDNSTGKVAAYFATWYGDASASPTPSVPPAGPD